MSKIVKFELMETRHFSAMAKIQCEVLPDDIFSTLGVKRLTADIYPWVFKVNAGSLVAIVDSEVVGFTFFTHNNFATGSFLLKNFWMAMRLLTRHPLRLFMAALIFLVKSRNLPDYEFIWVCVKSNQQGKGIGKRMISNILDTEFARNDLCVHVRTLKATPGNTSFYNSLGFRAVGHKIGRVWLVWP
jgi:GNAT superfamily N-acetyltransferase